MTLMIKEIHEFLNSLIAYVAIGVFLVAVSLIMWVFPDTNILDYGFATMEPVFSIGPYVFMFLVPAITMRSFAEEKRNGTLELLYTLPFRPWEIILGKYLASFALILFSLLPTSIYFYSLYLLGNPPGNLDISGITGSYLGLILLGGGFVSIGIFSSAITENQIVSFVLASFLCFITYQGFGSLASIDVWGTWAYYLDQFGIMIHYTSISKGVLDMRDITYLFGYIGLFLLFTHYVLEAKR